MWIALSRSRKNTKECLTYARCIPARAPAERERERESHCTSALQWNNLLPEGTENVRRYAEECALTYAHVCKSGSPERGSLAESVENDSERSFNTSLLECGVYATDVESTIKI